MSDDLVDRLRAAGCVFAEDEAQILTESASGAELEQMVERRIAGEPLEYIVGWVDFCGLQLAIEPGVFVPRQRTEYLVEQAIELAPPDPVIVDLCCGCGALGIAVASSLPQAELHAADIDALAVECARENVGHAGSVHFGDLFDALPEHLRGGIDLLLANVPYVPTAAIAQMPPEAREHEPLHTLDGGADGLDVLRRVVAEAPQWLRARGHLLIEVGDLQADAAWQAAARTGDLFPQIKRDAERGATVLVATRMPDLPQRG